MILPFAHLRFSVTEKDQSRTFAILPGNHSKMSAVSLVSGFIDKEFAAELRTVADYIDAMDQL